MKFEPRPHQLKELLFAAKNPRSINMSEPGCGKTYTAAALTEWYVHTLDKKVVWVQPNGLRRKNLNELYKFCDFEPGTVEVLDKASETLGVRKRKLQPLADQNTGFIDYIATSQAKVFVVGYKFFSRFWEHLLECHPEIDFLIGDEFHLPGGWCSTTSQSTRALHGSLKHIAGFYPMSGSIIKGNLGNVYPVISAIEPRFYGTYNGFLNQHAGYIDDYNRVTYWVNTEKVTKILQQIGIRHTFKEVYGDQPRVYETELVEMMPKMAEAYKQFEELAVLELQDSFLDGSLPGVNAIRCRQILAHPETFGLCEGETSGKDQLLEVHGYDHLDGGGLLVFSALIPEVERCAEILTNLGLRVGMIHGGVPANRRSDIDEQYQAGTLDAIVATTDTAGTGYNWQRTKTIVIPSLGYGDDSLEQAIRRSERELRDIPVRVVFLQYDNSIDQHIQKIVAKKAELTALVMEDV